MFFRILKRELGHKRGINCILFVFMLLATVFVASSVNNILVVTNATNYCMEKGKVGDIYVAAFEAPGEKNLSDWLKTSPTVTSYSKNAAIMLSLSNIEHFGTKKGDKYKANSSIFLQSQWKKNMLVFDTKGKLIHLKAGEIALPLTQMQKNGLKIGDKITLKLKDYQKTFSIKQETIDPAFGGDYVGITRFLISEKDFQQFKESGADVFYNYNIDTTQKAACQKGINSQELSYITNIDKDMISFAYIMTLITAGILIVVGICLIVIAFLILRFTIVFTLQEDYKEIGIMRAIGINNFTIKKIYLAKYLLLISVASTIGCFLSVPVSNWMINSVKKSMLMETANANFFVNIICSIGVAILVMLMCYLCTSRLNKFTAIEAIRSGQQGERYSQKSYLYLAKTKRIPVPVFLAINDICSSIRRYLVLILTFMIGTLLIILPLNAITSLKSDEMAKNFVIDTKADFYINGINKNQDESASFDRDFIVNNMKMIQKDFKEKGYDIDTNILAYYNFTMYTDNPKDSFSVLTSVPVYSDGSYLQMTGGVRPKNSNEIALSENQAKKLQVKIGDTISAKIGENTKEFIVTGTYQNFMHMGESAFLSEKVNVNGLKMSGTWAYQCYLKNMKFTNQIEKTIKKEFTQYKICNVSQLMDSQLGSTGSQMQNLKILIVSLVFIINILITTLMTKIFMLSEKNQIGILKSMGFSDFHIRFWQIIRMGTILCISVVLGAIASLPLNSIALRPIFGLMGATHMEIEVNPFEVYFKYPLLLLLVICLSTAVTTASIKRINLMEINNED